jgi:two-component system sensor histidine kinase AlgZ
VSVFVGGALTVLTARQQGAVVAFVVYTAMSLCFAGVYIGVVRLIIDRWLPATARGWQRALVRVAAVIIAAAGGGEAATRLVALAGGEVSRFRVMGVGLGVLGAIHLIEVGYEHLRRQVREGELREERIHRQALVAELAAIQARTDPHFLFNSLNTVAGLIEEDPRRAVEVVTRLAGFFRHSVLASRSNSVAVVDELRSAAAYLEIQGLRFGNRLQWSCELAPGLDGVVVPPFLLQPLVENAVTHGIGARGGSLQIAVRARRRHEILQMAVDDDGPGPGGSAHIGAGTSLADIGERLELLFGDRARLRTGPSELGGFSSCLELPLERPAGVAES